MLLPWTFTPVLSTNHQGSPRLGERTKPSRCQSSLYFHLRHMEASSAGEHVNSTEDVRIVLFEPLFARNLDSNP